MPENNKVPDNTNIGQETKNAKDLVFEQLKQGIRDIMETERFKDWCSTTGKLYMNNYSFNNAVLVYLNDKNNSYTMGYEAWKTFGRQIESGAKAIQILAPVFASENEKNGLYKSIKNELKTQLDDNPTLQYANHKLGQSRLSFTMQHNGLMGLAKDGQITQRFNSEDECKRFIAHEILGKVPVYFSAVNVFDVSKTVTPEYLWVKKGFTDAELALDKNGNPVKNSKGEYKIMNTSERQAKFNPVIDLTIKENDADKMDTLFSVLQKVSGNKGIPMTVEPIDDKDMLGYYERPREGEQGKGKVVIGDHLTPTEKVSVAFHEITHGDLHGNLQKLQERLGVRADKGMREVQAEAAAYITAKNFGIETDTKSFNYLAAWSKGKDLKDLEISLNLIYEESKALMRDIEKELDRRELTLTLEPKFKDPLTAEAKNDVLTKYADYIISKAEETANIGTDITNEIAVAANEDEKDILNMQLGQIKYINSYLSEMNQNFNKLEVSADRAEQNDLISRIEALKFRISQTEDEFTKLSDMRVDIVRQTNEQQLTLKQQFNKNPAALIEQLRNIYPEQIPEFTPEVLKYLASSKYINSEVSGLLNSDPRQFVEKVNERIAAIENVKAQNGAFVEIVKCENWGEQPIFENGTLVHPKLADRIVKEAETQIRMFKKEAEKEGGYYPDSRCDITVYSYNDKRELTALNTKLEIGDGDQDNLMKHMADVCKRGEEKETVLRNLNETVKERIDRNKIYTPNELPVDHDGVPNKNKQNNKQAEYENDDNNSRDTQTLNDWKNEIENNKNGERNGREEKEINKDNNKNNRGDE